MPNSPADEIVVGFWGRMGSGKTLNMTKRGILLSELSGRPLYANYHINHPNFRYFEDFQELEDVSHAIICYDEIHVDLDSRAWDKKRQQQFTHWFTQTRKKYCSFLYATQRINTLEKRIRENTQYLYLCTKNKKRNEFYESLYNVEFGMEMAQYLNRTVTKHPELLYNYYDTTEVIKEHYL